VRVLEGEAKQIEADRENAQTSHFHSRHLCLCSGSGGGGVGAELASLSSLVAFPKLKSTVAFVPVALASQVAGTAKQDKLTYYVTQTKGNLYFNWFSFLFSFL
jgi:hypothetical protein